MSIQERSHQPGEILSGEFPLEGFGDTLIVSLELQDTLSRGLRRSEVVGREDLALQDGEVDLDLVQPAGMDREMDQDEIRPVGMKAIDRPLTAMHGSVVDDQEDPLCRSIELLRHDLFNQAMEGRDRTTGLDAPEKRCLVNIPSRQIGESAQPLVLMFHPHSPAGSRSLGGVDPSSELNPCHLIGTENAISGAQRLALPHPGVEVQYSPCLFGEVRVPGVDPAAVSPGSDGVLAQPAPDRRAGDVGYDAALDDLCAEILQAQPGEGKAQFRREMTGQRFHFTHHLRGKNRGAGLRVGGPAGQAAPLRSSVCATCSRWAGADGARGQFACSSVLRRRGG